MTSEEIKKRFDQLASSMSEDDLVEIDAKLMIAQYIHVILSTMESTDVKRKSLAEKIGTSASFITQLFTGNKLINFITLAKIKRALGIEFDVSLRMSSEKVHLSFLKSFKDGDGLWVFHNTAKMEIADEKYEEKTVEMAVSKGSKLIA